MQFWYGIIRASDNKIRQKQVSIEEAPTQADFLALMEYDFKNGDVVVELDRGNFMTPIEFSKYVNIFYKNSKHVHITDIDKLMEGY